MNELVQLFFDISKSSAMNFAKNIQFIESFRQYENQYQLTIYLLMYTKSFQSSMSSI